jgi:hypothetical protein
MSVEKPHKEEGQGASKKQNGEGDVHVNGEQLKELVREILSEGGLVEEPADARSAKEEENAVAEAVRTANTLSARKTACCGSGHR